MSTRSAFDSVKESEFVKNIRTRIERAKSFSPRQTILVGVSGGVDSMVLLHVLYSLTSSHGWKLVVAHLNHQLRGRSSDADERLVRQTAKQMGLQCIVSKRNVVALSKRKKISIEMSARAARHEFLARTARRLSIRKIAVAHHADDRLELFFLRLLRGSGPEGLTGLRLKNPSPVDKSLELVRPLLHETKAALREFAKRARIRFREDASNASLDILRNRVRHELLPFLRKKFQPALDQTLGRTIEILEAESDFVDYASAEALTVLDSATEFPTLPTALQRRLIQKQLLQLGVSPDFELIEKLRLFPEQQVCRTSTPHKNFGKQEPNDTIALFRTSSGRLCQKSLHTPTYDTSSAVLALSDRRSATLDGVIVHWDLQTAKGIPGFLEKAKVEFFDADKIGERVLLRHWRPGDRFQPIGMRSSIKIQDFFTNEKVPRRKRHGLMLATTMAGEVFWIEGMRIGERFKLTKETVRRLEWRWKRM